MVQIVSEKTQFNAVKNTIRPGQLEIVTLDDFDALFVDFHPRITSFIVSRIGNREQANDLTQDTFMKAFKALQSGSIVYRGTFSAWIYRIATNTIIDMLRRKRLITWISLSVFSDDRSVGAGIPNETYGRYGSDEVAIDSTTYSAFSYRGELFENCIADQEIVKHILWKRMETKHSLCLWLYENDGLSCAEIAKLLHISTTAVKMRLMRARQRFIEIYESEMS